MILNVKDLCFAYGSNQVLKNISFDMKKGEILCLMGPNGSGKSTLIDNIMGIHKPQSGEILINQKPITSYKRNELAQNIAYLPQNHSITFPYTVKEVVMMGRTAYSSLLGEPDKEDETICENAMKTVGIYKFAERAYTELSGGELRLVLLARALCQDAPVIMMDEPTAHLDYKNEMFFLETVSRLCKDNQISILIATHLPEHAFYFQSQNVATKAMFLKNGNCIAYGTPDEIITEERLSEVYEVYTKIVEHDGYKTILLKKSMFRE